MTALPKPFFTKIHAATPEHYDGEERQRQIKKLQLGQSLPLVRNHDISGCNTAVKVCLPSGKVLGYLSAEDANGIAPLIDKGYEISALVKGKTGGINDEPAECIIEVLGVQMIEAGEERQTGLTEKQPPQKIFFPAGTKKTPAVTANETNILKSKRVESKLAMEIPPWERTEFAAINARNHNPSPVSHPAGPEKIRPDKKTTKGDFFCSLVIKIAVGTAVLLLVFSLVSILISPKTVEPPKPLEVELDKPEMIEAYYMAQDFVRKALKAPSTAKFPSFYDKETFVADYLDGTWMVDSYVDSQNSFGAMLRLNYKVLMTYMGNHRWRLDEFISSEQ